MINENRALGVVNLVLEDSRQKTLSSGPKWFPAWAKRLNSNFRVARNLAIDIRHAQTTLKILNFLALILGNFWVNKSSERRIVFIVGVISDNHDPKRLIYLDGSQCHANLMLATFFPIYGCDLHIVHNLNNFI